MRAATRRAVRAAAAAVLLCGVGNAAAEESELAKRVFSYRSMLKMGLPDSIQHFVADVLTDEFRDELVADPVSAYHFADAVATYARPTARRSPDISARVIDWTLALGEKVVEEAPDNVSARWAKAASLVARGRAELEKKGKASTSDWTAGAELVLQGKREGGRAPAIAAGYLVEAADVPGADRAALLDQAEEALARAGDDGRSALARALVLLGRAKATPPKGKAFLEEAVSMLSPLVDKDPPDVEAATLHNAIVTFARASKISLKADYRTKRKTSVGLSFEIPVSKWWEDPNSDSLAGLFEQLEKGNFRFFGAYRQYDVSGNLVRSIRFDEYLWTHLYGSGQHQTGGDNIKGLARGAQETIRQEFATISSEKDVRKIPFNKTWRQAYVFEVAGVHATGDEARARVFFFKSNDKQKTYQAEIFEYGKEAKIDPEALAFLESISEGGK
jgi:hypothetical protein